MQSFAYARAADVSAAVAAGGEPGTAFLAGGTEILNWMRLGIAAPERILDIARLSGLNEITLLPDGGLRIGALARLNDVALAPSVVERFPVLSQAILSAASPQLRNLATIAGNLLQKTRCEYFRAEEILPCNKKRLGSGCAARDGLNDRHAIFGWSDACVATHPSDPAAALAALDATVVTALGTSGRRIPVTELHLLPDKEHVGETVLEQGELITGIEIPAPAARSVYIKVRERQSYEFATASVALALDLDDGRRIARSRIALGSVAARPWRLIATERKLVGLEFDSPDIVTAVEAGFADARPLTHNAYKLTLARSLVLRAIRLAAEMTP